MPDSVPLTQPTTATAAIVKLAIYRDGWTGGLQLNIEDESGTGYRLAGPKFNGSSEALLARRLDERDATEIRRALDRAFPHEPIGGQVGVGWLDDSGCLHPDPAGISYRRTFGPWEPVDAT